MSNYKAIYLLESCIFIRKLLFLQDDMIIDASLILLVILYYLR